MPIPAMDTTPTTKSLDADGGGIASAQNDRHRGMFAGRRGGEFCVLAWLGHRAQIGGQPFFWMCL